MQESTIRAILNPATGEVVGQQRDSTVSDVHASIGRAAAAQENWSRVPRHRRSEILRAYAALVRDRAGSLAEILSREQGKPIGQSEAELELHCRLFEGFAYRVLATEGKAVFLDTEPTREQDLQITRNEPLGVVAGIIPFNFPIELFAHKVAPCIATGNTIVVKPSEETPLVTVELLGILREAGLPDGVVQAVFGGPEVGEALVGDPRIAAITFTGSTEVGRAVAAQAARSSKHAILELGGNDALIVLDDADLDLAIEQAVFGRTLANGQSCCANKRIIADHEVYDEVVERLTARFAQIVVGDPLDERTELGPVVSLNAAAKVHGQIERTIAQGASLRCGGGRDGAFISPTLLADVGPDMDVCSDMEIFGPVLAVVRAKGLDEAVQIANATRYGLSGGIFTSDLTRAMSVAARLKTGQVVINGTGMYRSDAMAFGGFKDSGHSREGLSVSLDDYVQTKTITLPKVFPAYGE